MSDRVSAMPFKHHALAYGFRFDAATRTLAPVTRELLAFEHGLDDTVRFPWVSAGYSTECVPDNSTDVTNTYRGGAWSNTHPTIITGITLAFPTIARIVPASAVKRGPCEHNPSVEYVAFPRGGGAVLPDTATVAELQGVLTDALLHGGDVRLLPPGNHSGCSLYVAPARFLRGADGTVAWRPAGQVIVDPAEAKMHRGSGGVPYNPNRVQFVFRENVQSVPWPADLDAPADGAYVVIDFDVRVEVAEIAFTQTFDGTDDESKRKIAAYLDSFGPERPGPHAVTPRPAAST